MQLPAYFVSEEFSLFRSFYLLIQLLYNENYYMTYTCAQQENQNSNTG